MKPIEEAFCRAARLAEGRPKEPATEYKTIRLQPDYSVGAFIASSLRDELKTRYRKAIKAAKQKEELERQMRRLANRARGKRANWVEPDQSPEAKAARMAAYRQKRYSRPR